MEIEFYRLRYLVKEYLTKLTKKYQHITQALAISTMVALIPAVGSAQVPAGFPETEHNVVFTQNTNPLSLTENVVDITPGESYAQKGAREARAKAGYGTRRVAVATTVVSGNYPPCPASFRSFYQEVGPRFGVPWQVIEAIHQVESGKSCHTARRSSGGAVGPMQFLPSTWRHYQWDCTGDGWADITNAFDAICTGAHYIGTGMTGYSLERSIYSYNHSWSYVNKVLAIAREIGYEG